MNIVITGASSGIGKALYDAFSGEHKVFGCSRHPQGEQRFCDVSQDLLVRMFAKYVAGDADHIDALILCAGIHGAIGKIPETDSEAWRDTIAVNLFGAYYSIKAFWDLLQKAASPRIITFAGGGAFGPFPNYSAYACAKSATVRLTECLAVESEKVISVSVAPGLLPTNIHQATLDAGSHRAGKQYEKAQRVLAGQIDTSMEHVISLVKKLIDPERRPQSGRTYTAQPLSQSIADFRLMDALDERIPAHG